MYLLCLETSGVNCSVAVSDGTVLLSEKTENQGKFTHSENLHNFIEEVVQKAKISIQSLDAIAISAGPGSYTGLRIGFATAKGLCWALNKPLISVPTLQILASQASGGRFIIPMLDARRMEVYSAVFNDDYHQIAHTEAKILTENSYQEWLNQGQVMFLGDGAEKFSKICTHPNAIFLENRFPQARDMIRYTFDRYVQKKHEDVAYFEPTYLK